MAAIYAFIVIALVAYMVHSFSQGFGGKLIAVEGVTLQGEEHTVLGATAAICGHFRMCQIYLV